MAAMASEKAPRWHRLANVSTNGCGGEEFGSGNEEAGRRRAATER